MQLEAFQNAAGHGGIMQDIEGEIIVKPCTQAEIDFYQDSISSHPGFACFMPTYMGTLALGDHSASVLTTDQTRQTVASQTLPSSKAITSEIAIVLENLEFGYKHPNVIDLKLGARLYAPGTEASKAARLDKVASETTSGSLNFRVAGMKVWSAQQGRYANYDRYYGRGFKDDTVHEAFDTFFASLLRADHAQQLLHDILGDLVRLRTVLEETHCRFFSSSVLLVYEGDMKALTALEQNQLVQHHDRSTTSQGSSDAANEDSDEDAEPTPVYRLRTIDFAHSTWCSGEGPDENVIKGLRSIEQQVHRLIAEHKLD